MRVGDLVIVASLGEIKAYRANPRTPEAEVGLKPTEVKLDLETAIDIIEAHKRISEILDYQGDVKKSGFLQRASSGENHNLKEEVYREIIEVVAEDINNLIKNEKRVFVALPKTIANDILEKIDTSKVVKVIEKDLIKADKKKIEELF